MASFRQLPLLAILLSILFCSSAESQSAPMAREIYAKANGFAAEKQYDKAIEAYKEAIKLDPEFADSYGGLGSVLNNMGRASEAVEALKTAVQLDPKSARAYISLGITLTNLRRPDEALASFIEAKKLNPNDPRIYVWIGKLVGEKGQFDESIVNFKKASELNPNDPTNYHNIGVTLVRQGKFADAIEPLKIALRLDPNHKPARFQLADAYSKNGQYREAIDSWTKFLELVPDDGLALTNRDWVYLYDGNYYREAAAGAQRYLSLYGWRANFSTYQSFVGIIAYRAAGMEPEAQALILQAQKRISPDGWPFNIVRFLAGEVTGDELLKLAANNDQRTEAHTYVGMDLRIKGRGPDAKTHFQWVKDFGNSHFTEYPLAVAELERLSN